jgi:hypothetical protein
VLDGREKVAEGVGLLELRETGGEEVAEGVVPLELRETGGGGGEELHLPNNGLQPVPQWSTLVPQYPNLEQHLSRPHEYLPMEFGPHVPSGETFVGVGEGLGVAVGLGRPGFDVLEEGREGLDEAGRVELPLLEIGVEVGVTEPPALGVVLLPLAVLERSGGGG